MNGLKDFYTLDLDASMQPDFVGNAENLIDIPNEVFSAVVCTEVLEHTRSPNCVAREIHRILKPSGFLVLTVPFWVPIHQKDDRRDYWRFTPEGVKVILSQFSLELLEISGPEAEPTGVYVVAKKASIY